MRYRVDGVVDRSRGVAMGGVGGPERLARRGHDQAATGAGLADDAGRRGDERRGEQGNPGARNARTVVLRHVEVVHSRWTCGGVARPQRLGDGERQDRGNQLDGGESEKNGKRT